MMGIKRWLRNAVRQEVNLVEANDATRTPRLIMDMVQITFSYEQLPSLEREYLLKKNDAKERFQRRDASEKAKAIFRPLAADLLKRRGRLYPPGYVPNVNPFIEDAITEEKLVDMLIERSRNILAAIDVAKAAGWDGGRVYSSDTKEDEWVNAMVSWYGEIIMALKASKGSVTVQVPDNIKSLLMVWGLPHMVYNDNPGSL